MRRVKRSFQRAKQMKRSVRWAVSVALIVAAGAALSLAWLLRSPPLSGDRARDLERIVAGSVAGNRSIKNCVLALSKGDGAFEWSGAAGIAHEGDNRAMTGDTPIFVASVTKLYTATIVMLLAEQGALALDDPMAKYLPKDLHSWHTRSRRQGLFGRSHHPGTAVAPFRDRRLL